jgi:dTMP kinase
MWESQGQGQAVTTPRFVIFEGVDGSGKTTLARALADYYRELTPKMPLYADNFPGSRPGTLGEWVYRLHHGRAAGAPSPRDIAPPALQLLHVAAHVDLILTHIGPTLRAGGCVILDRYWWSTYAYSRMALPPEKVWPMVGAERVFWAELPAPVAIYLTREATLKADELAPTAHRALDTHYREVIEAERQAGMLVHVLSNDATLVDAWRVLLEVLGLPQRALPATPASS